MTTTSTLVNPCVNELSYIPKCIRRIWAVISDVLNPRAGWLVPQLFVVWCSALQVLYSVSSTTNFWCRWRWKEISMINSPPQKPNSVKERNSFLTPTGKGEKSHYKSTQGLRLISSPKHILHSSFQMCSPVIWLTTPNSSLALVSLALAAPQTTR